MHRHEDIGFWKVVQCSEQMASICEFPRQGYTEPPTTTVTVPPEAKCPTDYDWYKYNDHCYRYAWFNTVNVRIDMYIPKGKSIQFSFSI